MVNEPLPLRCLGGEYACPPEDSGGPFAYPDLVDATLSPETADPEILEWVGDFDPELFDMELANKRLKTLIKSSVTKH